MSYHEKRAIVNMLSSISITVGYSVYLYFRYLAGGGEFANDPRFWANAFLIFIPISIAANILSSVFFTLHYRITTHDQEPAITDERDKLIELKGNRNALYVFSLGVMLAMVTSALGMPISAMFITIIYSGLLSAVVDELTQFVLYRRGF
ncbi:MAG TPA: hypothetical protein PKH77_26760 [Anaerolineae bacterium]|nr:hypothetical protein [Anaerolineae bacterium]